MRYLEGCGHTVPTSLGSYKAAVPLPPSPLNSNFSGASGLILRRRARAELEAQGARTHPRCSPSHLQAHTHSGDGGRVPGPGIHLGGEAPGSENGSPPSPVPSSGLSQRPLGGRREHQPRRRESSAPGSPGLGPHSRGQRTGDSQLPSSRRGTPGAKKCHRPTSPHAVPTQALHPHRSRDALLGSRLGAITRGRSPGVGTWEGI